MQPELSIFDSRYERRSVELLRDKATGKFLTDADSIAAIEKLCDELAQKMQAVELLRDSLGARKAHIASLEAEAGCSRDTIRVLSRMITECMDTGEPISTAPGATVSPGAAGDSFESPAQSCARSSEAEHAISGEVAGSQPAAHTSIKPGTVKRLIALLKMCNTCVAWSEHEEREYTDCLAELESA